MVATAEAFVASSAVASAFDPVRWMDACRGRVEGVLDRALPPESLAPSRLHAAMRYATLGGGKRVRALLAYAAARWAGSHEDSPVADAAAAAVELIHAYSLVHDDLPCMDDDDLRRGRPSTHVAFGEATGLLAGDALQTLAFEVVARAGGEAVGERVALLATASGSRGMAGGQAIDLDSVGKPLGWAELETMHRAKTGALLRASVLLGASVRGLEPAERAGLDAYANAVGLAFQVVDDLLDVETDTATLGKTAGKDAANDKPTVVSTLGLDEARALARRLGAEAQAALGGLGGDTAALSAIADLVVARRT